MEDKSYLDQLMDYMNENSKKRQEESLALTDTPQFGMPLTKKIKAENPNLPESDIRDYRNNVRDDLIDNTMNSGMASSGLTTKVGGAIEKGLSRLGSESRFRELLDNPMLNKVRQTFKQDNAIEGGLKNAAEMEAIKKTNRVPELEVPKVDEMTQQRYFKKWFEDAKDAKDTSNLLQSNKEIGKAASEKASGFVAPVDDLEKTVPGLSPEEIAEIVKKRAM